MSRTIRREPRRAAVVIERSAAMAALVAVPLIAPWVNVDWKGAGVAGIVVLVVAGALLAWVLITRSAGWVDVPLVRFAERVPVYAVLGIGVAVQTTIAIVASPVPVSDFLHYAYLAERIASGLPYVDLLGGRATLPPGWPVVMAPFVWVFGPGLPATVIVNVLLYLLSAWGIASAAQRLLGRSAARIAVLLFAMWPARILMTGFAAKENLLIALVAVATALCFRALDASARHPMPVAALAGIALGLAALTQPGVLVLVPAVPIMYRSALPAVGARRFAAVSAVVVAGAALALAPWMLRNCVVFDGQFCGIATNGGSVFYRANNANASGEFMSGRGSPLQGLPELERDRLGYALGLQWIRAHPVDAMALSLRKVRAYLGGDDYGAYWSVLRGSGGTEEYAVAAAGAARTALYRIASVVSLAYWVLLSALCARAILGWRADDALDSHAFRPLVYPLLCGAAVFGIFESGDRQHMFAVGPLVILAAAGVARQQGTKPAGRGGVSQR